jgi:hypothetical protein
MLVRLCLVQDSSSLKKLPLAAAIGKALSPLSVLSRSPLDHVVGVEELLLGAMEASLARLRDFGGNRLREGSAVKRVAKVGAFGSSSVGSSP